MSIQFITRIAPSPTGIMHLGTARTAYINWLAAKASKGEFILRIDDTDVGRNKDEYTKIILDSLDWLGLEPDDIYYQSKRTHLYVSEAKSLLINGKAKELDNGAICLLCPDDLPKHFEDTISGKIPITDTNKAQIHEKVILLRGSKKNEDGSLNNDFLGTPTYQWASTLDDYFLLGRSKFNPWIIRGVDHITNTPKQVAIWQALNGVYGQQFCPLYLPKFTHMGLITANQEIDGKLIRKKLSKRDGAASLLKYKEEGYSPEAVLNFMLRLGWSPKGDGKEHKFINKERAIELFFEGNLRNSPVLYDLDKLNSFRKHYK